MDKEIALANLNASRRATEQAKGQEIIAVYAALDAGVSWTEIGTMLEITKQTAHARYAARYRVYKAAEKNLKPSKISDTDVAGTSETPSIFSDAQPPATTSDPIHQGITDTGGTAINWTGRRQFSNPKKCPFCETKCHRERRTQHWWIYPDCTLTDADYTAHDQENTK